MTPATPSRPLVALGYPSLLLGLAVLLATSLLASGHLATRDAIATRQAEDLQRSLAQVLPPEHYDNDLLTATLNLPLSDEENLLVYQARQQDKVTGVAYSLVAPKGYGGPIQLLMAVDLHGAILGVRVLAHKETPGLGDKLEVERSDWIDRFKGRSLANTPSRDWAVRKDGGQFDQFTGATITPRAVVDAVHRGLQIFASHRTELTQPLASPTGEQP